MRVTYVNVRARHLLKKSMVRAPKNMAAIVIAIVMNLPGMTLQPSIRSVSSVTIGFVIRLNKPNYGMDNI